MKRLTATQAKRFNWAASSLTRTEKATYPWDTWLDGAIYFLTHGEDFSPHPLMMERIIRTRATGRKAHVRLRHVAIDPSDDTNPFGIIALQRTDITPPYEAEEAAKAQVKAEAAKAAGKEGVAKTSARKSAAKVNGARKPAKATPAKTAPAASKRGPRKAAAAKVTTNGDKPAPAKRAPAPPSKRTARKATAKATV